MKTLLLLCLSASTILAQTVPSEGHGVGRAEAALSLGARALKCRTDLARAKAFDDAANSLDDKGSFFFFGIKREPLTIKGKDMGYRPITVLFTIERKPPEATIEQSAMPANSGESFYEPAGPGILELQSKRKILIAPDSHGQKSNQFVARPLCGEERPEAQTLKGATVKPDDGNLRTSLYTYFRDAINGGIGVDADVGLRAKPPKATLRIRSNSKAMLEAIAVCRGLAEGDTSKDAASFKLTLDGVRDILVKAAALPQAGGK